MGLLPPDGSGDSGDSGDNWLGLTADPLPVHAALAWAGQPHCGAVVLFTGTVRNHSPGRPGVRALEYEAYDEEVDGRLAAVAIEARRQWPAVARLVILHRSGRLAVGEPSVVVVVSAPHRPEAFAAAQWCIDTVKGAVPIWKRETWAGGDDWSAAAHPVEEVAGMPELAG